MKKKINKEEKVAEEKKDVKEVKATKKKAKKVEEAKEETVTEKVTVDPKEDVVMASAPELKNGKGKKRAKKNHLFSSALFKESLHSNRLGLSVVSIGNAIIMVIIISILSTLHINSTATALADLFSNADYENTVKSGAISLYSAYDNTAETYESFIAADDQAQNLFAQEVEKVEDSTLNSSISTAKRLYDLTYAATQGDAETKKSTAKSATMAVVNTTIDNSSTYTDDEKKVAKSIISYYFDIYGNDTSKTTKEILKVAIPSAFTDAVVTTYNLDETQKETTSSLFSEAITRVYDSSEDIKEVKVDSSLKLLPVLAGENSEIIGNICNGLEEKYNADKSAYINDDGIRESYVSTACQEVVMETLASFAYYQYLPDFTVEYKTNDLGYPVRLVGTGRYAENGNEIKEEIAVTTYNPDVYIKESEKMGKTSNMLQKMRKEVLTGEPYTDEEIEAAKEEAKENLVTISLNLSNFMNTYLTREDGKNAYFDGTNVNTDNIASLAVNEVSEMAKATLISSYNEKNDPKISSIEEITVENSSMSGSEMMTLVRGYAASGISSYETYYEEFAKKGYSTTDCNLLAMNKGSQGVMAQLPTSVDESLKEMGDMNTYGIIVGVVAFGMAALLIPMVYTILLSKSLVAEKVETGSLAFTLSTPTTRNSFIFTQGCYLVFSEVIMAASLLLASIVTRQVGIMAGSTDLSTSLPVVDLCLYALGNFMVALAVSGINFLTSCHFNKTSESIGVGGGLTIFFFICSILGLFATKAIPGTIRINMMSIFNYMTIDSLFDALAVMNQDYETYWFKLMFLLIIAFVTYIVGGFDFKKKDLPL